MNANNTVYISNTIFLYDNPDDPHMQTRVTRYLPLSAKKLNDHLAYASLMTQRNKWVRDKFNIKFKFVVIDTQTGMLYLTPKKGEIIKDYQKRCLSIEDKYETLKSTKSYLDLVELMEQAFFEGKEFDGIKDSMEIQTRRFI